MSRGDQLVDRGADRLQKLAEKAAAGNGVGAKLAQPLAEDAEFLRKLKPSLIAMRARGEAPTNEQPGTAAPSGPQLDKRPKAGGPSGGPNPFVLVVAALAVGVILAKWIDWRGHAHPRG